MAVASQKTRGRDRGCLKGAYVARCQAQARNRHCSGPRARIEVISCPTRSWLSHTARYRCVWELYRSSSTQETACRAFWLARGGTVTSRRGHETHRHDYTRLPAALSDELGRLSTSLGLFVSPPRILSTESVVGMEWKGMSTAIATRAASPVDTAVDVSLPRAPPSQGRSVKLLLADLRRA